MIDVCTEKHKRVDERLDGHDNRLDNHSERLKNLETTQARTEVIVQNVCKQISTLVKALWWFTGIGLTTLLGFFIWYIQNLRR